VVAVVVGWKALSGDETLVAGTAILLRVAVSKLRLNNDINDVERLREGGVLCVWWREVV